MPITVHKTEGELTVELEGEVTVRHAQEAADRINAALDGGVPVTVRTAGLRDVDTGILQLLSSLRKTVPVLSFESPSEEFLAAVDRCGLRRELLGGIREGA
jgi:ABC-type transporter Mla MlaB component